MTRGDRPFLWALAILGGGYVVLILSMVGANLLFLTPKGLEGFNTPEVRFAIWFSLVTSTLSALLATVVAVPMGYVMSRSTFRGKRLVDAVLDIPIVLPPLVVGLSDAGRGSERPCKRGDRQDVLDAHACWTLQVARRCSPKLPEARDRSGLAVGAIGSPF